MPFALVKDLVSSSMARKTSKIKPSGLFVVRGKGVKTCG
jgi:hypothetical protein